MSGRRVDRDSMDAAVVAAASIIARAFGIDARDVARACSNRPDGSGFVSAALERKAAGRH